MSKYFHQFSWAASGTWPDDVGEFVFLARAVETIGRQIYLKEWTGEECTMSAYIAASLPVLQDEASSGDREVAHALLTESRLYSDLPAPWRALPRLASPSALEKFAHLSDFRFAQLDIGARPDDRHARNTETTCTFSSEQWSTAVRLQEERRNRWIDGQTRFALAKTKTAEAIALGQVVAVLKEEAALIPSIELDAAIWNTAYDVLNCSIAIDLGRNASVRQRQRRLWVFVTRDSLAAFILSLGDPASTAVAQPKTGVKPTDRSPKKAYPLNKVMNWAERIYADNEPFSRSELERRARVEFPNISIPLIRNDVWNKRPSGWGRRAKKGA